MKYLVVLLLGVVGFSHAQAESAPAEEVAVVAEANTIIDPQLMNKGVWAEPYFRSPGEAPREVASQDAETAVNNEKSPDQYLDVLAQIPFSEPSLSRVWAERKILNSDD